MSCNIDISQTSILKKNVPLLVLSSLIFNEEIVTSEPSQPEIIISSYINLINKAKKHCGDCNIMANTCPRCVLLENINDTLNVILEAKSLLYSSPKKCCKELVIDLIAVFLATAPYIKFNSYEEFDTYREKFSDAKWDEEYNKIFNNQYETSNRILMWENKLPLEKLKYKQLTEQLINYAIDIL